MSQIPEQYTEAQQAEAPTPAKREYERSGLYPENGKAFRIWALLAWLGGTIVVIALISAGLNYLLLK